MSDKARFKRIRADRRRRGLCERCGREKARAGAHIGILCEQEIKVKRIVAPPRRRRCEKIGRLERNLAFIHEAEKAVQAELSKLRAG